MNTPSPNLTREAHDHYQPQIDELISEVNRLREIIRLRGQHADACDFYGECHCELKEFE